MSKFVNIIEEVIRKSETKRVNKGDVQEVMERLIKETLTSGDSALVGKDNDPHKEQPVYNGSSITSDDVATVLGRCKAMGKDYTGNQDVVDSVEAGLEFELNKLTKRDKGVAVDTTTRNLVADERYYLDLKNLIVKEILVVEEVQESAPPGFPEKLMHKLKAKYSGDLSKAFATAWALHNKYGSELESMMPVKVEQTTTGAVAPMQTPKAFEPKKHHDLMDKDNLEKIDEEVLTNQAIHQLGNLPSLESVNEETLEKAKLLADAITKACEYGNESFTVDNLEEVRNAFAEKTRNRNYARQEERFGRDPLGTDGLKPDEVEEAKVVEPDKKSVADEAPVKVMSLQDVCDSDEIDEEKLDKEIEALMDGPSDDGLPKDANGALEVPHTNGPVRIGKVVEQKPIVFRARSFSVNESESVGKKLIDFITFQYDKKKLLEESAKSDSSGKFLVRGILQKCNTKNANGRTYPKSILEREVEKYMSKVQQRRALGELDHPESSIVNLQNVSHNIVEMHWEGDDLLGTIEILDTQAGRTLKELFMSGLTLGVSSRGVGSVDRSGVVQSDFELLAFDFVSNPSVSTALFQVN